MTDDAHDYVPVICIGAGFSGICLGAQLQRKLGFSDFHIYEMFDDFGGTWLINTYPGIACDIPSALYSFSFAQVSTWSAALPPGAEIHAYIAGVAEQYGLRSRTTFRTRVAQAVWDEDRSRWVVHLVRTDTGETFTRECSVLVTGVGAFSEPNPPSKTADFSRFEGSVFHSARWDHSIDIKGKDVVVIGNGCSANQIVPAIASEVGNLTQVVRSAQWILPPIWIRYSPTTRWAFSHIPLIQRLLRLFIFLYTEFTFLGFFMTAFGSKLRHAFEERSRAYVRKEAPKEYQDILIPRFEIGCKRRIFDTGYVQSLHRPNVHLVRSDILSVNPREIVTSHGTFPADVVVLATGFTGNREYLPFTVIGRGGQSLRQHWAEDQLGGPGAYNCTACAGFPNFFFLLGPNSGTGHTSAVMAIENMTDMAIKVMAPVLRGEMKTVEVKPEAEFEYVSTVQRDLRGMVWSNCHSWYKADDGWNANTYPWSQFVFWWRCQFPNWHDWLYTRSQSVK